jgi:hypothetical protein
MWQKFKSLWQKSAAPADTDTAQPNAEPVILMVCSGPVEASMVVSQLVDAGIPATSMGADSASVFGMQSGLLADVRILVPAEFAESARELLGLDDESPYDDAWEDDVDDTHTAPDKK